MISASLLLCVGEIMVEEDSPYEHKVSKISHTSTWQSIEPVIG